MRKFIPMLVLAGLVLASLACGGGTPSDGSTTGGGGDTSSNALFSDDFSDSGSGWDEDVSDTSTVGYDNGKYVIGITTESWLAWANPGKRNLSNIHIEVTARNTGEAQDAGFGIICNSTPDGDFYYLAMSVDGYFVIAKKEGEDTIALSDPDNQWITSDVIPVNATSYQLGADCANGTLTLYVNGDEVGSAEDDTFTRGDVGLIAATFSGTDSSASAEVTFDSFEVTQLE